MAAVEIPLALLVQRCQSVELAEGWEIQAVPNVAVHASLHLVREALRKEDESGVLQSGSNQACCPAT